MRSFLRSHKKILTDFIYSFIAYALPTIVLQFAVQPLIAKHTTADENGLFIALFNVVKLAIGILIMPLANLRLLKKLECEKDQTLNSFFNFLFAIAVLVTIVFGSIMNGFYRELSFQAIDIIKLASILLLMCIHDYYSISFRIVLNYKKIVIDNILIVIGYGLGMICFIQTGIWELIFIIGYLLGTTYVLFNTRLWQTKPSGNDKNHLLKQYGELSASDLLKNTSTYCDRLIIYPVLGGYDVSVYNAAAVVSKAISVVSSPLRNVLLSYIVNNEGLSVSKRKIKKVLPILSIGFVLVFCCFWAFSATACHFLYPQYADTAKPFIPVIIFAIMIETCGAVLNIVLLRFAETIIQTVISAIKLFVYLLFVLILAIILGAGLWGFCMAILIADITFFFAVLFGLKKNITITD